MRPERNVLKSWGLISLRMIVPCSSNRKLEGKYVMDNKPTVSVPEGSRTDGAASVKISMHLTDRFFVSLRSLLGD